MSDLARDPGFDPAFVAPTRYWHRLDDGRLQCDLCPRACKLRDGQRGLCFVRARDGEGIILTTYGRSSGFCIDPIEKKPLNHFFPGSSVLSFGTAGCNLACKFCQNWDISKSRETDTLASRASPEAIATYAHEHGCRSVAFTYNDPVIFHEYAIDVARACHELDVCAVAVTAGYICAEPRVEFFDVMDAANVDLKAFSEDFYCKITGSALAPVLETLEYIAHESSTWLEITTLLIPGYNDSPGEIEALSQWIAERLGPDIPVHFSAFHPDWKMREVPHTPPATVKRARAIALSNGLRYVYTGNIHDDEGDATACHLCDFKLIQRHWYEIGEYALARDGSCPRCGTPCAGHFSSAAGSWGRRRRSVSIS